MTTSGQPQPPTTVLDMVQALWDTALGQAQQAAQQQWESAQAELAQQRSQLTADRAELERERQTLAHGDWPGKVSVDDLQALAVRIVGERHARRAFSEQAIALGRELHPAATADRAWIQFTERLLAASIGAASARLVLTSVLRGSGMHLDEVMALLDEAGQ